MKKIFLVATLILFVISCMAQVPSFKWAKSIGSGIDDYSNSIAHDSFGNIYITGTTKGGDLDPGPATYTLPTYGLNDILIMKLDPIGNLVWAKCIGDIGDDAGYSIVVDDSDYVYVNGLFTGSDFDTGPGTYTLTSGTFVSKMDVNGNLMWVKGVAASTFYGNKSLAVDNFGNIYFGGYFNGTTDFDSGLGVFNLISAGNRDVFVSKLNQSGNFLWAKKIGGTSTDELTSLSIDSSGNVCLIGSYGSTTDFDPGPGTFTMTAGSSANMFVTKLNTLGDFMWAKSIKGTGLIFPKSSVIDILGNIYISGYYTKKVDFDPSLSAYLDSAAVGCYNIFLLKLNSLGSFIWEKPWYGGSNPCIGNSVVLDSYGGLYMTGSFYTSMDFDPSSSVYQLFSLASFNRNVFALKLDTAGIFKWATSLGNTTCDGFAITVDKSNNVYTTGGHFGIFDADPSANTYYLSANGGGSQDIFIQKMDDCFLPMNPINSTSTSNKMVCFNNTHTLTAVGSGIINWFASPTSTNVIASGNAFSPPLMSPGTYTYYVSATTCTTSISRTAVVYTVNPLPSIAISSSNSICIGSSSALSASGAVTYTWNTGATAQSLTVTPITSSVYTVTGTDLNNCSNTQTVSVIVDNTCQDVWPGDANSDGIANNLDVLELGLHYTQTGAPRASASNAWQSYFSNNWIGTISNGKNLNHSDCNGDGVIDNNDTLAIYNNYGLNHAFKPSQTNTVNPQLSIVPDQTSVVKGSWGTASIYLGDAITSINNINGIAFTVDFDNALIETNSIYMEYQNSFLDAGQNLKFRKLDFSNSKLFTATTHTVNNNVSGNGKIATLHYQIKSALTTDQVLNLGVSQANQSDASGAIVPLTSGTATLMAMGTSVGLQELNGNVVSMSPNPTNGSLTINSKTLLQKIEVVSITGQTLLSETPTIISHTLYLQNFANGIYFVNVYQNNQIVKREKIVLNK